MTHFTCTTHETQRDFLEVAYKISFPKKAIWTFGALAAGAACVAAYAAGMETYLLPCGIAILAIGAWNLVWPALRARLGYRQALKAYGGAMKPSTVTFGKLIRNETPNGTMEVPYEKVRTIHFLTDSMVIEDDRGVGIICSKSGFDAPYMDCVNFLCDHCPNLEL